MLALLACSASANQAAILQAGKLLPELNAMASTFTAVSRPQL
jgi:hypothetical protein